MLKIIGTDVSIRECLSCGYLMMEFNTRDVHEFETVPEKYNFLFMQTNGAADWKGKVAKTSVGLTSGKSHERNPLVRWDRWTLVELIEIYEDNKKGIDSACGESHSLDPKEYTDVYKVLYLASDIQDYLGRIMESASYGNPF